VPFLRLFHILSVSPSPDLLPLCLLALIADCVPYCRSTNGLAVRLLVASPCSCFSFSHLSHKTIRTLAPHSETVRREEQQVSERATAGKNAGEGSHNQLIKTE
jgi:hypothetical protein